MQQLRYLLVSLLIFASQITVAQDAFYKNYKGAKEKYLQGKFDDVLQISLKALDIAERSGVPTYIAYANIQVGSMNYLLGRQQEAIKWYMSAMAEIEQNNIDSMKSDIYHNTSVMYNEMKMIDSCLKYSNKAIALLKEKKKYNELSQALSTLADIYIKYAPDHKKANQVLTEAEKYGRLANDDNVLTFALMKRASLLAEQSKYREALTVLNSTTPFYMKSKEVEGHMFYYSKQVEYRLRLGDPSALKFNDTLTKIKDGVFKKETAEKIAEAQTKYQTEKKERENKLLQQENLLQQAQVQSRNRTIIGLVIGIILIGALVAWRISVNNLRKKEKELEASRNMQKEKERISRDLHDNVGGQLSYVLFSIDGLNDQDEKKRLALTENINESVRNVIGNLRETIWAISDESVSVNDFSDKLKVYVRAMFRNKETKITFNENISNDIKLKSLTGLNLFRICQEIINNAFKYAEASELSVSINSNEHLEIKISDNGKGFDVKSVSEKGYGLSNIKKRADEAGIEIHLNSQPGKGTAYQLIV